MSGIVGHRGLLMESVGAPPITGVVALLHMDGTDTSTTFTDEVGHTWTASGGAQIDTAFSKFGGASGLFNGSSDVTTPASSDFGFGSGDFTVEGWVRINGAGGNQCMFDNRGGGSTGCGIYCSTSGGIGVADSLSYTTNSLIHAVSSIPFTTGAFHHWAICRAGGTLYGWVNGVNGFGAIGDGRTFSSSAPVSLGAGNGLSQPMSGHLDEVRITKGTAIYTSAFTPPSSPFTYP